MVANAPYVFATKTGTLTVQVTLVEPGYEMDADDDGRVDYSSMPIDWAMVTMEYVDAKTSSRFHERYTREDLCELCPLFHEKDEVNDTLADEPTLIKTEGDLTIVRFAAHGKVKTYFVNFTLTKYKPISISEILKNYDVEQKKEEDESRLAKIEARMATFERNLSYVAEILASINLPDTISAGNTINILLKMMHSPVDQLKAHESDIYIRKKPRSFKCNHLMPVREFFINLYSSFNSTRRISKHPQNATISIIIHHVCTTIYLFISQSKKRYVIRSTPVRNNKAQTHIVTSKDID